MNVKRIYLMGMILLSFLGVTAASQKDSVALEFYPSYFALSPAVPQSELPHVPIEPIHQDEQGFSFSLDETLETGYLRIRIFADRNGDSTLMSGFFFATPGDRVTCRHTKEPGFAVHFTGRGSEKYQFQYKRAGYYKDYDRQLQLLEGYRSKISKEEYKVLRAEIRNDIDYYQLRIKRSALLHQRLDKDSLMASTLSLLPELFSDPLARKSKNYPYYLAKLVALVAEQSGKEPVDYLKTCDDATLHDKILLVYLREHLFDRSIAYLRSMSDSLYIADYQAMATSIIESVTPGIAAYDFALPNERGETVRLSDFRGKIVFIDFWFTGCSACSIYYQQVLAQVEERFKNYPDIVFVSISVDQDRERWLKSIRGESKSGYRYTSGYAVNLFTDGQGSKHPVIEKFKVQGYPRPLLIDRNGVIITADGKKLKGGGVEGLMQTIQTALVK